MAIDFVHYHQTDLALHIWSGNFNLKDYISATRAYMLAPAAFEILDIRRLNLDSIGSMDLYKLASYLRSSYESDRHVPGKTAVVYHEDIPQIYCSSQRLFHNFSIWVREHKLPRAFSLFSSMADAIAWLGNSKIRSLQVDTLMLEIVNDSPDQVLNA